MQYENGDDVELILKTHKDSQTGFFSNQRLLLIKAGIVSYFSNVPQKFVGSARAIELSGQLPKFTIPADQIQKTELNSNTLSLLFKKSKLISRNDFYSMIKGEDPNIIYETMSQKGQTTYQKWVFKCQNMEMMNEFYRLVNLFRSNNPKFKPNFQTLLSGYQSKKGQARQLSMAPVGTNKMFSELQKHRTSDVPIAGRDSFLEQNNKYNIKRQSKQITIPQQLTAQDIAKLRKDLQTERKRKESSKKINEQQKQRLNRLKNRIEEANQPLLGVIDQKNDEDKHSEMSKMRQMERKIQIKLTYQQSNVENKKDTLEIASVVKEELKNIETIIDESNKTVEKVDEMIKKQEKVSETKIDEQSKEIQQIVIDLNKTISEGQIKINSQNQINQRQSASSISIEQPTSLSPSPKKQQLKSSPLIKRRKKQSNNDQSFSLSICQSDIINEQKKRNKKKKLMQFLRSTSLNKAIQIELANKNGISIQDLQKLINQHSTEQQSCWQFIQGKLSMLLSQNNMEKSKQIKQVEINQKLIEKYNDLCPTHEDNNLQSSPFDAQLSFQSYLSNNQQEQEAIQWMEEQLDVENPKQFSSKILNRCHFKIAIRTIQFKHQQEVKCQRYWIVNNGGFIQQFLAYLRLQKVVKQINSNMRNDIQLSCAEVLYMRYKQFQALTKQWILGHTSFPLKSIKSLQFIHRCKQMKHFHRDFPQFSIVAEVMKEGDSYRLHLERISNKGLTLPLQNQLKKLIFPFDNQLDIFYVSEQFHQIQTKCLQQIQELLVNKGRITEQDLYILFQRLSSNVMVDTLCKFLGCRVDKKGNIYFHHTVLRLGERQFGEQIALIRRSRKRGNIELAKALSRRLMSRVQYYRYVTPMSNFIHIYLQLIDLMVVQQGQLHRAVPILLKVLGYLSQYQIEQYPVYLSLMKTFLRVDQLTNFTKTLQNCRLFLNLMFKDNSLLFDFSFRRIIILLTLKNSSQKAKILNEQLLDALNESNLPSSIKNKYVSKVQWDYCSLLLLEHRNLESFNRCQIHLLALESNQKYNQQYWLEGVLNLSKSWLQMDQANAKNTSQIQKRIERALDIAFSRDNLEIVFVLLQLGHNILQKCKQLKLPHFLQSLSAYQRAQQQFNETQAELILMLTHPHQTA